MSSKPKAYRVTDRTMEEDCPICGWPVMVGDTAFETGIDAGYCSQTCARRASESVETEARLTTLETAEDFT